MGNNWISTSTTRCPRLEEALLAARRGIKVLQIYSTEGPICQCPLGVNCKPAGKHPVHHDGLHSATCDEALILQRYEEYPGTNWGFAYEASGLLGWDIDVYHDDDKKLAEFLSELSVKSGTPVSLPDTVTIITGSNQGIQPIFKSPGFPVRGYVNGIVLRGRNYGLLPGSKHKSGNLYSFPPGYGFGDRPIAELPDIIKEAIRRPTTPDVIAGLPKEEPEWVKAHSPAKRLADACAWLDAQPGEIMGESAPGHSFQVVRNFIRSFWLSDSEAATQAIMTRYDPKCVPPWRERMGRLIWSAYSKAHTPVWGNAYRGEEQRLNDLGLLDVPVIPAPVYAGITDRQLRADLQDLANTQSKGIGRYAKELIKHLLKGGATLGDDRDNAVGLLVQHAPKAATDEQLSTFLVACFVPGDEALAAIRKLRNVQVPSTTLNSLAAMAASMPVVETGALFEDLVSTPLAFDDLPPPANDEELRGRLTPNPEGEGYENAPHNLNRILKWSVELGSCLRFNLLTKNVEILGGRFSGKNVNVLPTDIVNWLSACWNFKTSSMAVAEQLLLIARNNEYNPIADYMVGLVWDGIPRLDTWLIDYCGAKDIEFVRRVGAMWMISACARGIVPGSKVDTVLVLEGRQGSGKSRSLAVLGGPWFSDTPLVIGNKDSLQIANSRWIIELAELSSLRASETEAQKAFISGRVDNYRPPYGKAPEEFPRFAIFGGSTNEGKYLIDATGNRRYWPVAVSDCNAPGLRKVRDQLWAEAVFRYRSSELNPALAHEEAPGERWWFEDEDELEMAAAEVEKRRPENTWASIIKQWVCKPSMVGGVMKSSWSVSEIAHQALDLDIEKLPRMQKSIIEAMKEAGLEEVVTNGVTKWGRPDGMMTSEETTPEQLAKAN